MDDINRLTAQTIAAEEAIAFRDDQIKKLREENLKMKDEIDNTVPILKAQVNHNFFLNSGSLDTVTAFDHQGIIASDKRG